MKIINKINSSIDRNDIFYSFEYFPPKTEAGVENLYSRIERMANLNPDFIDITWGAGGSTSDLTIDISTTAQNLVGVETQVHMTCTNMKKEDLRAALQTLKDNGLQNILALRGDPPLQSNDWVEVEGGFKNAVDLVRFTRQEFGDYFGICVAGYPEGHPNGNYKQDLVYLKEKIDAGADYVITQLFYDCDQFLKFVYDARAMGINVPILPGIMPINNYNSWMRMIEFCKTKIPPNVQQQVEQLNVEDDEQVREFGIKLCVDICKKLLSSGIKGLHFYTLNLEKSVTRILEELDIQREIDQRSPLPWRPTANVKRQKEDVRPIFWANRPKSYIARTSAWDEFPNGRWGDSRSPAFGDLSDYHIIGMYSAGQPDDRTIIWGECHENIESVYKIFVKFLLGEVSKLPWFDKPIERETIQIQSDMLHMNEKGFLTINSQPAVNAAKSQDPVHGWGPKGGYVYKKAYIEFFASPENTRKLIQVIKNNNVNVSYHAVNIKGEELKNFDNNVTAVTWGVFPNKEIVQPTVVDSESFLVWKNEAFALWLSQWASIYSEGSQSRRVIQQIHDTFYLVNVIDHDYVEGNIFNIFNQL
ncbi:methylenetetrahydrofolate reductase [Acrasis kona]|uniref:methylenetetrahydrofolate reductase (NADH) n=1 Tax=Acrasis kona TaxID=1008807 RepID=A0AAW2ZP36_9EUKA